MESHIFTLIRAMFAVWTGDTRVLISYFILSSSFFCWSVCRSHFFVHNILCRHIECSPIFFWINKKSSMNELFCKLWEIHSNFTHTHLCSKEGFCSLNGRHFVVITWLYLNYILSVSASQSTHNKKPSLNRSLVAIKNLFTIYFWCCFTFSATDCCMLTFKHSKTSLSFFLELSSM